jgi:hypothetical protein
MKRVSIPDAQAGEIVARPVVTSNGVVLVQPGTPLSAELLARLDDLGIDTICLEGPSPDAKPLDEILQALEQRFAGHEQNTLMMELKALVAARLTRGASEDCVG